MQLKTFIAKDMREALVRARREMGDEAVIVTSQRTKEGGVIVRVAAEAREADAKEAQASQPEREAVEFVGNFEQIFFDGMIRRLRSEPQPSAPAAVNFRRSELLRILGRHRVPESLAHRLAEAAEKSGLSDMTLALASALDTRMRTAPLFGDHPNALLLLGPCGAGKTAVAAKIGAHLMRTPRSVKLIATDNAGAGAVARLEAFAQHLDIPCERAACADALPQIVARAAKADALAVADTAGFDPRDGKARATFAALAQIRGAALVISPDIFFNSRSKQIAELSVRYAVPTVYQYRPFAASGGLLSYGSDETEYYRPVGVYTGKILNGAKPGDLPVVQFTKTELIVNLKTAKALGLTVPLSLLGRADEVIE